MTRKILTTLAALVVAVVVAPQPANAVAGAIHGTVTGPGGTPLSGITVTAWSIPTDPQGVAPSTEIGQTTTAADGTYGFNLSPGGNPLSICFTSPSYASECYDNSYLDGAGNYTSSGVTSTQAGTVANAELTPGGTLSGIARTNHDVGLPGMTVRAINFSIGSGIPYVVTSQAGGAFEFQHLPPGTWHICAYKDALTDATMYQCTADAGGPETYAIPEAGGSQVVSDLVFQLQPEGVKISSTGADRIQWSWDGVKGAKGYTVTISKSPLMSAPIIRKVSSRWTTFTGLKKDTIYYAVVRARDAYRSTAISAKVNSKVHAVAKPTGEVPEDYDGAIWRWAPYTGAAKYLVKMRTGSSWVGAEQHVVTGTTITLGIERDSSAAFKVIALDADGHSISTWSATAHASVPYHPV